MNNGIGVLYMFSFGCLIAKEDIEVLEYVQERATEVMKDLEHKTDEKQLRELEKKRFGSLGSLPLQ